MRYLQRFEWAFFLALSILVAGFVYWISFSSAKERLVTQAAHTIEVATNVKLQLLQRKLYSLEQQLNLLSTNGMLLQCLGPTQPVANVKFHSYVRGLLDNQGCSNLVLIRPGGTIAYHTYPGTEQNLVPNSIFLFAKAGANNSDASIVLNEKDADHFFISKRIPDAVNGYRGTLFMEAPIEFLSIELHNAIALDSLKSYLISTQGTIDYRGKLKKDTCTKCFDRHASINFSPREKIKGTWTLLSVYPVSQISVQHIIYVAALDSMIGFLVSLSMVMIFLYVRQIVKKSKGITHADILLVQTTWNAVSEYSHKVINGFYKHLFANAPEVKPMFRSAQAEQEKRMALMLNTIVNSVDSLEEFKGSITQLAKKHVHMGVKREYFPIVVNAIVSSVGEQYGKDFSPAHKKAWDKILTQVSQIMIEEMEIYQSNLKPAAA